MDMRLEGRENKCWRSDSFNSTEIPLVFSFGVVSLENHILVHFITEKIPEH